MPPAMVQEWQKTQKDPLHRLPTSVNNQSGIQSGVVRFLGPAHRPPASERGLGLAKPFPGGKTQFAEMPNRREIPPNFSGRRHQGIRRLWTVGSHMRSKSSK